MSSSLIVPAIITARLSVGHEVLALKSGVRFPGGKPSIDGSSNGRMIGSEPIHGGSSPSRSAIIVMCIIGYMTTQNTITKEEMTLEQKLEAIAIAMQEANGDTKKEATLLNAIVDPQDANNCEGCQ